MTLTGSLVFFNKNSSCPCCKTLAQGLTTTLKVCNHDMHAYMHACTHSQIKTGEFCVSLFLSTITIFGTALFVFLQMKLWTNHWYVQLKVLKCQKLFVLGFHPVDPQKVTWGGLLGLSTQLDIFWRWCQGLFRFCTPPANNAQLLTLYPLSAKPTINTGRMLKFSQI